MSTKEQIAELLETAARLEKRLNTLEEAVLGAEAVIAALKRRLQQRGIDV